MVHPAHILVGGGTGFVGRHLVRVLKGTGAKVRVITRQPRGSDQISWAKIESQGLPQETTAVVNVAGRNILDPVPWTASYKKEVYSSRIDTNRLLVDAIHKATVKPRSFVTISGVGYYKPSDTIEYDENWTQDDDQKGSTTYLMQLAKDMEKASELSEQSAPTTRRVVIRSGAVIGHDGGIVKNLKLPFNLFVGGPIGTGNQWFPWIHVDDLAEMFKFAIINDHVSGIINGVAPEQVRNKDFAKTFANLMNKPSFVPFPSFVVKLIFGPERSDLLLDGMRVKSRASLLGFRCQYPTLREACHESLMKH